MSTHTRRHVLLGIGGALVATRSALAQQAVRVHRIGWLDSTGGRDQPYQRAFDQRLRELGFAEGRNVVIEFRTSHGRIERLPELAAELARQRCDVFVIPGADAGLRAITQASRDTPIVVVANDYDPVAAGHIASLARPGGRITGVSQVQGELPAKRLELLRELLPRVRRVAVLALASGNFVPARRRIPALALKHRLPSMFGNTLWAEAGGLLSYGPDFSTFYRRAAEQVARILGGASPADMPVEQPATVELVVNLETAMALGVKIPESIRVRADRVIG